MSSGGPHPLTDEGNTCLFCLDLLPNLDNPSLEDKHTFLTADFFDFLCQKLQVAKVSPDNVVIDKLGSCTCNSCTEVGTKLWANYIQIQSLTREIDLQVWELKNRVIRSETGRKSADINGNEDQRDLWTFKSVFRNGILKPDNRPGKDSSPKTVKPKVKVKTIKLSPKKKEGRVRKSPRKRKLARYKEEDSEFSGSEVEVKDVIINPKVEVHEGPFDDEESDESDFEDDGGLPIKIEPLVKLEKEECISEISDVEDGYFPHEELGSVDSAMPSSSSKTSKSIEARKKPSGAARKSLPSGQPIFNSLEVISKNGTERCKRRLRTRPPPAKQPSNEESEDGDDFNPEDSLSMGSNSEDESGDFSDFVVDPEFVPIKRRKVTRTSSPASASTSIKPVGPFPCDYCGKVYPRICDLNRHRSKSHSDRRDSPYPCPVCAKILFCERSLMVHIYKFHENDQAEKPLVCPSCGKKFAVEFMLKRHENFHLEEKTKPLACDVCDKRFHSHQAKALEKHKKNHVAYISKETPCQYCDQVFKTRLHLFVHLAKRHKEHSTHKCSHCPRLFPLESLKLTHENGHLPQGPYKCYVCDKSILTSKLLEDHFLKHFPERSCESCNLFFYEKVSLLRHEASVHSQQKLFECDICQQRFTIQENMMAHRKRIHESFVGKYTCETCGQLFAHKKNLRIHIDVHHLKISYTCEICGANVQTNDNLKHHMKIHQDKPFVCSQCGKKFISTWTLKRHETIHSEVKERHECHRCGKVYRAFDYLKGHMKKCVQDLNTTGNEGTS